MRRALIISGFILCLTFWEFAAAASQDVKFFVSSPISSAKFAVEHSSSILKALLTTLGETLAGFCLAILLSFFVMLVCLVWPRVFKLVLPVFITSQVLPIITLAPLFIVLFGLGLFSKIAMVVLMCFFPIFINFSAGINSISRNVHEFLYVYDAPKAFRIFRVMIPLSTRNIFTGLKISTTMAVMGAIVSEFLGARDGLGKNLYLAPKYSQPELTICSITLTAAIGWFLYKTVERTEEKVGRWYTSK